MERVPQNCAWAAIATALAVLVSGCSVIPQTKLTAPQQTGYLTKAYEWRYAGKTYKWQLPIPESLYQHYTGLPRKRDYDEYVKDPDDDEYLDLVCSKLEEADVNSEWGGKIDFALSFVQCLEYTDDNTTGFDEYPRYPVETLVDEGGDCEDTSILFVSIVKEMGYAAALLQFDEAKHMAAGVSITSEVIDSWKKPYPLTYYESDGRYFAYCETTGSGWQIGEKPDWVGDEAALVIRV